MEDKEYQMYVNKFLKEYEIISVKKYHNLVRVDLRPGEHWSKCTFIFTENHIACFGDIAAYTWRTTWNAAKFILQGTCNAKDFLYLSEKLEHYSELKEFEFSDEIMKKIKEYLTDGLEEDELEEFNKKWDDNYYLLYNVDEHRLNELDEFFEELGVDDYYEFYSWFQHLQDRYYIAVAILRCIEDYFSKQLITKEKLTNGK